MSTKTMKDGMVRIDVPNGENVIYLDYNNVPTEVKRIDKSFVKGNNEEMVFNENENKIVNKAIVKDSVETVNTVLKILGYNKNSQKMDVDIVKYSDDKSGRDWPPPSPQQDWYVEDIPVEDDELIDNVQVQVPPDVFKVYIKSLSVGHGGEYTSPTSLELGRLYMHEGTHRVYYGELCVFISRAYDGSNLYLTGCYRIVMVYNCKEDYTDVEYEIDRVTRCYTFSHGEIYLSGEDNDSPIEHLVLINEHNDVSVIFDLGLIGYDGEIYPGEYVKTCIYHL